MGKFFDEIPDFLIKWIKEQQMFWVATAPLQSDGHVNVSPKGLEGTFHVVNSHKVWYEDLSGSGVETISHLRENGRITVLFNAFDGPPRIARLFGKGTVYEFGTPEYEELLPAETRMPGSRAVIVIDVYKVGSSCGYAVPLYTFQKHRTQLLKMGDRMEGHDRSAEISSPSTPPHPEKGLKWYWAEENVKSLDGLPGLRSAHLSPKAFETAIVVHEDSNPNTRIAPPLKPLIIKLLLSFSLGILASEMYLRWFGSK